MQDDVKAHNMKIAAEMAAKNKAYRTERNPEILKSLKRSQAIYGEIKRQGALDNPRKHEAIRQKVMERSPELREIRPL